MTYASLSDFPRVSNGDCAVHDGSGDDGGAFQGHPANNRAQCTIVRES